MPTERRRQIDLAFRPRTYWPISRGPLGRTASQGVRHVKDRATVDNAVSRRPDYEVEIARIEIASTFYDVYTIQARGARSRIMYRVDGPYPELEASISRKWSSRPLTLGELIGVINSLELGGQPNSPADIRAGDDGEFPMTEAAIRRRANFVQVSSEFYPDLQRWFAKEADDWLQAELAALKPSSP